MSGNFYNNPYFTPPRTEVDYPHHCESGCIILFSDNDWNSQSYTIDTNSWQYPAGNHFSFSNTRLQDSATWVVFNLPENVVCTLTSDVVHNTNPYDFAHAGVCVDLIGNGKVQTIDLKAYGANDCLSGGVWRVTDPSKGWFQFFSDENQTGTFITIFLDEWPESEVNSLSSWWLKDSASSISYSGLQASQRLKLSDNTDGSGAYLILESGDSFGSAKNFADNDMNDKVSSFSYSN